MTSYLQAEALKVYVGQPGQAPNTGGPTADWLVPLEISRTSGGRSLDYATFELNLGDTGGHVRNLATPLNFSVEVQVWAKVNGVNRPIFAGDLNVQDIEVRSGSDGGDERVIVTAQTMPYHFGDLCDGIYLWNNITEDSVKVHDEIYFNPVVDGRIFNNMSDKGFNSQTGVNDFKLWVDPEQMRSDAAELASGQKPTEWTIKEAVNALCQLMNSSETYIKNFDKNDPAYQTMFDDAITIRNVVMRRGLYLPEYLDALLLPLGFDWFLDYDTEGSNTLKRTIKVFKRASGTEKTLKLADIGEKADFNTTNTETVRIVTDIGRTINKVVVWGAVQEREIAVELQPAWDVIHDGAFIPDDLDMSNPDSEYEIYQNVYRLFVANEAGDWDVIGDDLLDLSSVFDDFVPRRRKIRPPLGGWQTDTEDRGEVFLEYWNGESWRPLKKEWVGDVRILDREIGVYFAGSTPPPELMKIGDDMKTAGLGRIKLRASGTITGDKRLKGEAENFTDSPNERENVLYIDASDRFRDADTIESGSFASQASTVSVLIDDQDDITEYAEKILETEISASMNCQFVLMGLNGSYGIGDVLTKIDGRNIDLNRRSSAGAASAKYPQIIGVVYRPQSQQTELITDTNETVA